MYKEQDVEFLLEESDTVMAYERRGEEKPGTSSQQDREQQVLNSMNRVQQIEMVQGMCLWVKLWDLLTCDYFQLHMSNMYL